MTSVDPLSDYCPPSIANFFTRPPEASFSQLEVGVSAAAARPGEPSNRLSEVRGEPCRWLSDELIVDCWRSPNEAAAAMANQSVIARYLGGPMSKKPTPDVAQQGADGESYWTVLERSPSWPAAMITSHPDAGAVAIGIGECLRNLHRLDIEVANELDTEAPLGWDHLADQVRSRLVSDGFDRAQIRQPYDRYESTQLLKMFEKGRPDTEDLVISHGSYTPANVLFNGGAFAGFVGLGSMRVVDRHFDLAQMHLAIGEQLGPEAVFGFYDGYGLDPSLIAIDHYVFVHTLLMS